STQEWLGLLYAERKNRAERSERDEGAVSQRRGHDLSCPAREKAKLPRLRQGYTTRGLVGESKSLRPACPSWLEPCLPIHITEHREALSGSSSGMISTICPRFSREVPASLNPSGELSTIRQGTLFGIRSRLTTRLAPFF